MIPYGRQNIDESDIQAVIAVLKSDFLTQGPVIAQFEKYIAQICHANYAVAVNSATSALHIACMAVGLGPGDIAWTSPITFVASANCARYCGAEVDFVDIDPETYNLSIQALKAKLIQAELAGKLPKVVIPVHLSGQPCEMKQIHALGQKYGFKIIEDASHAIGGKYAGEPIGNCRYSDITVFSFHPVKIITTGEGGMALTNHVELAKRMERLRSHGITRESEEMTHAPDGPWYYQQIELGFNYRMTDLQAALGLSQVQRLGEFMEKRHSIAHRYDSLLLNVPVKTPWQHPDSYSGWHLYIVRLQSANQKKSHSAVFSDLRDAGIGVNKHYIPVYLQPYYQNQGFQTGYCPESEKYYSEAISLPIFPGLSEGQQDQVVKALKSVIQT
jgi:UDP-4-amino-4,6-dideoxy-N-acetyl-beta-L-altrosamine transaminase